MADETIWADILQVIHLCQTIVIVILLFMSPDIVPTQAVTCTHASDCTDCWLWDCGVCLKGGQCQCIPRFISLAVSAMNDEDEVLECYVRPWF